MDARRVAGGGLVADDFAADIVDLRSALAIGRGSPDASSGSIVEPLGLRRGGSGQHASDSSAGSFFGGFSPSYS